KTLRSLKLKGSEWSFRLSGSSGETANSEVGSARFRPGKGWVQLEPIWLGGQYLSGVPVWYPYFDDGSFSVYASLLAALEESATTASGVEDRESSGDRR
ncbi:MAG: hypothetical protein ACO31E_13830, partial [Phycisphaerales bacterium]